MFGHKLNFDCANLIFAALSLTLLKVMYAFVVVTSCGFFFFWQRQKGDNFRVMARVLFGPFDINAVSQYL